jgi:hypothetical protein
VGGKEEECLELVEGITEKMLIKFMRASPGL